MPTLLTCLKRGSLAHNTLKCELCDKDYCPNLLPASRRAPLRQYCLQLACVNVIVSRWLDAVTTSGLRSDRRANVGSDIGSLDVGPVESELTSVSKFVGRVGWE